MAKVEYYTVGKRDHVNGGMLLPWPARLRAKAIACRWWERFGGFWNGQPQQLNRNSDTIMARWRERGRTR